MILRTRVLQFLAGAGLGSALDILHVRYRVLQYAHPFFRTGQAIWVPALFGSGGIALGALVSVARKVVQRTPKANRCWTLILFWDTLQLFVAYLISITDVAQPIIMDFSPHGLRRLLVLLVWFVFMHHHRNAGAAEVVHAIGCAWMGVLVEYVLVRRGAFWHIRPDVAGLPLWLPALYMNAAPLVATVQDLCC